MTRLASLDSRDSERWTGEAADCDWLSSAPMEPVSDVPDPHIPDYAPGPGGYGSGPNWVALAVNIVFHALILAGLLSAGYSYVRKPPPLELRTFDISNPPPPAPPEPQPLPVELAVETPRDIVLPDPPIRLPTPNLVATVREVPPLVQPVPTPSNAPPAPAPSPVVPPDFRASQLNNPGPSYPYMSRKKREEGVVLLRVLVNPGGRADNVLLHQSSGHDRLDKAAMATVRKWRFVPAKQAGRSVEAWVLVPVTFALS